MAITIDTGHPTNVHPKEKKTIGRRLAAWALGTTYRATAMGTGNNLNATDAHHRVSVYSGPLLNDVERKQQSIVVSFKHVGDGLRSLDGNPLRHFEICGADGKFFPATATILRKNAIELSSEQVKKPKRAR